MSFKLNPRPFYEMRQVRLKLGLSQREVAGIMYLQRKQINEIESGSTRPNGASTILYGIVLEGICKDRGTTFEDVLKTYKLQAV